MMADFFRSEEDEGVDSVGNADTPSHTSTHQSEEDFSGEASIGAVSDRELSEVEENLVRLVDNTPLTIDQAKKGDFVSFTLLNRDGLALGNTIAYRLGSAPPPLESGWTPEVEECLLQMRLGNVVMLRSPPLRVRLDGHVPRRYLPSALGYVDITRVDSTESRKRPQGGTVVWYLRDGAAQRRQIPIEGQTPEDEALGLLSPGQKGELHIPTKTAVVFLEPQHVAAFDDISACGDGTLWKLALNSLSGRHDRARLGKTVDATVDGECRKWRWGYGFVSDVLELATFRVGVDEEAEIWNASKDELLCVIRVLHVGEDAEFITKGVSIEEASCMAAKVLYQQGRTALAHWHWSYVRDSLPESLWKDDEEPEAKFLAAQAAGNLAVCSLAMGRNREAVEQARQSIKFRSKPRGVDWIRLANAARALERVEEATAATKEASKYTDLTPTQKLQIAALKLGLRKARATLARDEKDFCQRAFAA